MKMKNVFFGLLCSACLFTACSDDDDPKTDNGSNVNPNVPETVLNAFKQMYGNVKDVKWEEVSNYHVARFNGHISRSSDDYTSSAWYTKDGQHCQSDEDIAFSQLPEAVKNAFNAYKNEFYPDWQLDECELVIREGMGMIYVIEIEKGEQEREISVSEFGDILKDVIDADDDENEADDILPVVVPDEIQKALQQLFPDTYKFITILEIEKDDNEYEVDILDGKRHKEVTLDLNYKWIKTEYEVTYKEALKMWSQAIIDKFTQAVKYLGLDINDPLVQRGIEVDVKEHATKGITYEIEIEVGDVEFGFLIDKDGNFIIYE